MTDRVSHPAVLSRYEGSEKIEVPDPAPAAVISEERLYRLESSRDEETRLYTEDGRARMAEGAPGAVLHSRCTRCHHPFEVVYLRELDEEVPRSDTSRFCRACYEHQSEAPPEAEPQAGTVPLRKPFEAITEYLNATVPVPPEIFQGMVLLAQSTLDSMTKEERTVLERFCAQFEASWQADAMLGPDEMAFRGAE